MTTSEIKMWQIFFADKDAAVVKIYKNTPYDSIIAENKTTAQSTLYTKYPTVTEQPAASKHTNILMAAILLIATLR